METRRKLSLWDRLAYASANFASMTTGYGIVSLAPYVFNLGLGIDPALVGVALAAPRFVDLFTDPLAGYLSDRVLPYVSRRAFVGWGALFSAVCFAAVWWVPIGLSQRGAFIWLLSFSCATAVGWSLLSIPWQALGFELTADYHERTSLMATSTLVLGLAGIYYGWSYAAAKLPVFPTIIEGARWVGSIMAASILLTGCVTGFLCRPPETPTLFAAGQQQQESRCNSGSGWLALKRVITSRPFGYVAGAVVLMCVGVFSVTGISPYIAIYYVEHGDQARGAILVGWCSTAWQGTCLLFAGLVSRVARRFGKSRALILFLGLALVGNVSKWVCYNPAMPWLIVIPYVLFAAGFTGLWTLAPSMVADICEYEELRTGHRDDGLFAGFYTWMIKLGSTIAFVCGGLLLNFSGFRAEAGADQGVSTILRMRVIDFLIPAITIVMAIVLLSKYPLNEKILTNARAQRHS